METEFDPDKAAANWRKHRVRLEDAESALWDPMSLTIEDPDAEGEVRFVTLGMAATGRLLVIVHSSRNGRIRLISARRASSGEAEQYHAQEL